MKTSNYKLLSVIIISVLILVIGYGVGLRIANLQNDGAFDRWEDFSAPVKAEKIVEATSNLLWIQTLDGSIYQGNPYCQQNSDCLQQWQIADSDPVDWPGTGETLERNHNCRFGDFPAMAKTPQEPIECVRAQSRGPYYSSIIYYAIQEDGTVITLKHRSSETGSPLTGGVSTFLSIVVCAILLFIIDLESIKNRIHAKWSKMG